MRLSHPILALGVILAAACSNEDEEYGTNQNPPANNNTNPTNNTNPPPQSKIVTSREGLRADMRKLWTEHVFWTRMFIIDFAGDLPEMQESRARLLRNQDEIGNAIKPFYGDDAGTQLTGLLETHISGAADVLTAAKAGDPARLQTANQAWFANADQIAAFLAQANPSWPEAQMKDMMHEHLNKTTAEAVARLQQNWNGDIAAYDDVVAQIGGMADQLADGIAKQFPEKVSAQGRAQASEDLHVAMRALWEDHVAWTRVFIVDFVAGTRDTMVATQRLLRNQDDIGNAVKPIYGDNAGNQLAMLLREHITGAAAVLDAAKAGDQSRLEQARTAWFANADRIAVFLAGANPNWPEADVKAMMRTHLDQTITEATKQLDGDFAGSVAAYDQIEAHILKMADVLSDGVVEQFPEKFGGAQGG